MTRTGRPARVEEVVVEVLLDVLDELLTARGEAERLDIGGRVMDNRSIPGAERAHDVLLEERDELSQTKRL